MHVWHVCRSFQTFRILNVNWRVHRKDDRGLSSSCSLLPGLFAHRLQQVSYGLRPFRQCCNIRKFEARGNCASLPFVSFCDFLSSTRSNHDFCWLIQASCESGLHRPAGFYRNTQKKSARLQNEGLMRKGLWKTQKPAAIVFASNSSMWKATDSPNKTGSSSVHLSVCKQSQFWELSKVWLLDFEHLHLTRAISCKMYQVLPQKFEAKTRDIMGYLSLLIVLM